MTRGEAMIAGWALLALFGAAFAALARRGRRR